MPGLVSWIQRSASKPHCLSSQGFFEEIEDLKYALQQSARLNTAYEKALHKLCKQFGVPLPNVPGAGPSRKQPNKRERDREFKS